MQRVKQKLDEMSRDESKPALESVQLKQIQMSSYCDSLKAGIHKVAFQLFAEALKTNHEKIKLQLFVK